MSSRSGAALVIAIVVLAAMLLIGLPFLFTQSGSLSGTRSYAHSRLASMGQDSAQSMGVAAGASAVSYHWQQDGVTDGSALFLDDWTDLFLGLGGNKDDSGLIRVGVNRIDFDTRNHVFALPGNRYLEALPAAERDALLQRYPTMVGLSIEDESGKLDPNHLDTMAWTQLLQQVGINDWTDGQIPVIDPGRMQVARALTTLRYQLPGGRITAIEQLLQAEPPATIAGTNTPVPNPRRGLTRAELERLRPYLTVAALAQARGGLIDLGTVIGVDGPRLTLDHDAPNGVLAFAETPLLIGAGTTLVVSNLSSDSFAMPATGETTRHPHVGDAVAIDAPPTVNLHQAEQIVRRTFAPYPLPGAAPLPGATPPVTPNDPPQPNLLTGLQTLLLGPDALGRVRTAFDLLSPLAVVDKLGKTHALGSRQGDNGANGQFDVMARSVDIDGVMTLDATATMIRVQTGSLDRFPTRGYALLEGTLADTNESATEIIEYRRSVPALPLTASMVASGVEVILYDVRRGLDGITGRANNTAKRFRAGLTEDFDGTRTGTKQGDLHLTILMPREQHPLAIASQGVITISSTATVTDPAGNQTAQDQHRVIAQAVPQETALEARWDKQVAFHALLAQRHGSLLASFPEPISRLDGVLPQDAPNVSATNTRYVPFTDRADPDGSVGVRPALMRTLLTNTNLDREWTLAFAGASNKAVKVNGAQNGAAPLGDRYVVGNIRPEGLTLDSNRVLAYPNPSNGFITDAYNPTSAQLAPIHGRQFALWVRPDADWNEQVALLDMRMPTVNVSERLTGNALPNQARDARGVDPSDAAISNRFTLVYDPAVQQLVLVLNPGTIPHAADYGPPIPRQTYGPTLGVPLRADVWPAVNPECLGGMSSGDGNFPMASKPPEVAIQHRYLVGDRFQRGEWHLVQVAFSSNQPGGMSIIVDGLVGRDVTRQPTDPTAMQIPGDHMTQPALVLAEDLLVANQVSQVGTRALYVASIPLSAIAWDGATELRGAGAVRRLLPDRGLVRIGREYISYQWIDDTGALRDCVRARRQRTHADEIGTAHGFHNMEPHQRGSLVYPGGFAFSLNQDVTWWRGGCHLAQPMPDGDPAHKHQVWAEVGIDLLPPSSTIPLAGTTAIIAQLPPRGWIRFENGLEAYYDNAGVRPIDVAPPRLLNVHHRAPITVTNPDGTTSTQEQWVLGIQTTLTMGSEFVLISQEVTGRDPLTDEVINPTTGNTYAPNGLIQLYDARPFSVTAPNGGRTEWISYSQIRSRSDHPGSIGSRVSYLINVSEERLSPTSAVLRGGFWFTDGRTAGEFRQGARARERTGFAPTDISGYVPTVFPNTYTFREATTRVIPVQTQLEIAYLLEAGDVVTLMPKIPGPDQRPIQLCVRYSADDAFNEDFPASGERDGPSIGAWNSTNKRFAFTEAIPQTWNNAGNRQFNLLCWPCWTPEFDLSQLNNDSEWRRDRLGWVLPWGNAFAPDFTPNNASPANRSITFLTTGAAGTTGAVATIDAIHAGEQPGWQQGTQAQANIVPLDNAPWLEDQPLTGRLAIRTDQPVFTVAYGLVDIGGEVFAYKQDSAQDSSDAQGPMPVDPVRNNQAWLIGRSLLGSSRRAHQGSELVLHLPIGPIAEINEALPVDALGVVEIDGFFAAPAMLLTSRNGDRMELTTMPNSHTAPWLRGMYNTTPVAWEARAVADTWDNLAPLAIGWWPRYPSALRQNALADPNGFAALLASRSYAWAGFPLRFHDCVFDGTGLASVTVLSTGDRLFDLHALGLDGVFDWNHAGRATITTGGVLPTAPIDVSGAFVSDRFVALTDETLNGRLVTPANTRRPVDGAELRVVWSYTTPPLTSSTAPAQWLHQAATNGNRAPMIGPVYLRTRAPNKVINVER